MPKVQYKYVVKKIVNKAISPRGPKEYITWDVYKVDPSGDSFELFAEFKKRSDAILVAKAVNLFLSHAGAKRVKSTVPRDYFSHSVQG